MSKPHFLFLQGMQSSFFKRVGILLESSGCRVSRINLCLGDWIYWHNDGNSYNFTGKYADWNSYLSDFLVKNQVTDLVLVGEQRKYHKEAIVAAKSIGVKIIVTDFGYLRPDWIALEENGMHGNSLLPREIDKIIAINNELPTVSLEKLFSDSEVQIIINDMLYSISTVVDFYFFPHYVRSDMRKKPLKEFLYSFRKWAKLLYYYQSTKKFVQKISSGRFSFYLFAMQLEHDFQIVAYSQYNGMMEPLREVLKSFSENCNGDDSLIIKNHPCDFGIKNWREIVMELACEFEVAERVYFIDGGTSLDIFLQHCKGLITVNSTSGIRALQLGCPVKALSRSIYNMKGLTSQGDLDGFWHNAEKPDNNNVNAFINVIANKLHVRGVFFKEPGMTSGTRQFADKLYKQEVGM